MHKNGLALSGVEKCGEVKKYENKKVFNLLDSISFKSAIHLICSFVNLQEFLGTLEILHI